MRGWRYIGRVDDVARRAEGLWIGSPYGHEIPIRDEGEGLVVDTGDVIAVSPHPDGPLRHGTVRVLEVDQRRHLLITDRIANITSLASGDYVLVATAIGADIFRRAS